jgi:hypothetical protein
MFLYLHDGILWGEPRCVYDMAYYKLTDVEVAKIPPFDQFRKHKEMCKDDNGKPEMLQVELPKTEVGTRHGLSKCKGLSFQNLASEEHVRAVLMGTHRCLGANSPLRKLDEPEALCMKIVQFTFSAQVQIDCTP